MRWEPAATSLRVGRQEEASGVARLLLVRCGPYRLGIPAGLVRGVVAAGDMVPLGLPDLEGLLWRDRALLPVTRLGPSLGLGDAECGVSGHGVLIHSEWGQLCFLVDEALDLIEVPDVSIRPLPPVVLKAVPLAGLDSAAMADRLLLIMDPVQVLGRGGAAELMEAAARFARAGNTGVEQE